MCANGTDTLWYPTFRFLYIYIYKLMVRYWSVIRLRQQQPAIEHPLSPEVPINHLQNDQKPTLYIVINYLYGTMRSHCLTYTHMYIWPLVISQNTLHSWHPLVKTKTEDVEKNTCEQMLSSQIKFSLLWSVWFGPSLFNELRTIILFN